MSYQVDSVVVVSTGDGDVLGYVASFNPDGTVTADLDSGETVTVTREQVSTPAPGNWPLNRVRRAHDASPLESPAVTGRQLTDYSGTPGYAIPPRELAAEHEAARMALLMGADWAREMYE
jgi:hypothetical protein